MADFSVGLNKEANDKLEKIAKEKGLSKMEAVIKLILDGSILLEKTSIENNQCMYGCFIVTDMKDGKRDYSCPIVARDPSLGTKENMPLLKEYCGGCEKKKVWAAFVRESMNNPAVLGKEVKPAQQLRENSTGQQTALQQGAKAEQPIDQTTGQGQSVTPALAPSQQQSTMMPISSKVVNCAYGDGMHSVTTCRDTKYKKGCGQRIYFHNHGTTKKPIWEVMDADAHVPHDCPHHRIHTTPAEPSSASASTTPSAQVASNSSEMRGNGSSFAHGESASPSSFNFSPQIREAKEIASSSPIGSPPSRLSQNKSNGDFTIRCTSCEMKWTYSAFKTSINPLKSMTDRIESHVRYFHGRDMVESENPQNHLERIKGEEGHR